MARGTGNKRGPRQPAQRQANSAPIRQLHMQQQPSPRMIQVQQQQQYQQPPIMQPGGQQLQHRPQQWYNTAGAQQTQMQPRLPPQQVPIRQKRPQTVNVIHQQQQQPQQHQLQFIPQQQRQPQQPASLIQQQLQQQQVSNQMAPQIIHLGPKRRAQEPGHLLSEQALRDPPITALQRNINRHLISHTLHRTFGVAKIF